MAKESVKNERDVLVDLLDEVRAIRLYVQVFLLLVVLGGAYLALTS